MRAVEWRPGGLVRPAARFPAWVAVRACAWALAVIRGLRDTFTLGRADRDAVLVGCAARANGIIAKALCEAGGVAIGNRRVVATVGGAELIILAASGGQRCCVVDADITFGTILVLRAKAETVVVEESGPALAFVKAIGYTRVVFVAAIVAAVRLLAWSCAGRFGTVTVAICRGVCRTGLFAPDRGAFLRGTAALGGLGERVGDADSVGGGTRALVGELGAHALVLAALNALGALGAAVGFASGVSASRVRAFGGFVHTLSCEAISICVAGFQGIAAIGYVVDLADAFIAGVRTISWSMLAGSWDNGWWGNTGTECLDDVEAPDEKEKRSRNCHDGELLLVSYAVTMQKGF